MFSHKTGYFFGNAGQLWFLFVLIGIVAWIAPFILDLEVRLNKTLIVGGIAIFTGITLVLNFQGLEIDTIHRKYRFFTTVFGIKHGHWNTLPELKKLMLTSKNVSSWNTPNGISPTFKTSRTIYTIALFSESEKPVLFFQTERKALAIKESKMLSAALNIPLET